MKVKVTKSVRRVRVSLSENQCHPPPGHRVTRVFKGKDTTGKDLHAMHMHSHNGDHVGYVGFCFDDGNTHIRHLHVDPRFKRMGYGRKMIDAVCDWHSDSDHPGVVRYAHAHDSRPGSIFSKIESLELDDIPLAGGDLRDLQLGKKVKVKVRKGKKEPAKKLFRAIRDKVVKFKKKNT